MQQAQETRYDVTSQGEIAPKYTQDQVRLRLAKIFSIEPAAADALLNHDRQFEKRALNALTAQQYHHALTQAGLIAEITPLTETQQNTYPCPKCHALSTDAEQCSTCGIYFHKVPNNKPSSPANTAAPLPEVATVGDAVDPIQRKASRGLSYGTIVLIIAFFIDAFLIHFGFDMGWLPYAAGILLMTYGAVFYVITKGYSGVLGLLGLGGLIGLGLLMLLPDRRPESTASTNNSRFLAVFLLAIGAYWWVLQFQTAAELGDFDAEVAALQGYHPTYPTAADTMSEAAFEAEQQATQTFVTNSIQRLAQDYRPDDIRTIADHLFDQMAAFIMSIHYHRFYHTPSQNRLKWPQYVSKTAYANIVTILTNRIRQGLMLDNVAFNATYQDWIQGYRPDELQSFHREINQALITLREKMQFARFNRNPEHDTRKIDLSFFQGTYIHSGQWLDNNLVQIQLNATPLKAISQKTIILYYDKIKFYPAGGTLSNKYINHADLNLFRDWIWILQR